MDIPLLTLVEIKWEDASSLPPDWVDPADEKPIPQMATSVGFLVAVTPGQIVIASTFDGNYVNSRFQIPRGMVKSIKPLRKKRKPKVTPNGIETARS